MIRALLLVWAFLGLSGAAQAQQWIVESDEATGRHAAQICGTGDDALCFELSCEGGGPLEWKMWSDTVVDMVVSPSMRVLIFVGSNLSGELDFQQTAPGRYTAPFEQWHDEGTRRLKNGNSAQLRMWFDKTAPPVIRTLGLNGSRNAISTVETACAQPNFVARAVERRTSDNPLVDILADMKEACDALGGQLIPREGLAQAIDLDGQDPVDMQVNHARAECTASESLVCGAKGCVTSLWLGLEEGTYRQAFEESVKKLEMVLPGVVEVTLDSSACGQQAGGVCTRRYVLVGDQMEQLAE